MRSWLLLLVALCLSSVAAAADCGDVGQKACTIAQASFVGEKPKACPAGTRFDPIDGGSCWQCAAGMNRTVFPVNGAQACERPAGESLVRATLSAPTGALIKTHCAQGKLDPLAGVCFSCPAGYNRTGHPVKSDQACSRAIPAQFAGATKVASLACPAGSEFDLIDGGTCWRCPSGYGRSWSSVKAADACTATTFAGLGAGVCRPGVANIRGTCMQIGACGQQGQRPCEIGERVPSCNAGLKENFKANVCEALRPGETPFLGGLASLSAYYGDSIKSVCKTTLGNINLNDNTQIGVAAECSKMVFVGAGCEYLADALGANQVALVGQIADTPRQVAESQQKFNQFRGKVDQAYQSPECRQFAETLAPATLHGQSSGTRCADGQFWDPNGSCYSCPAGYTRTLEPVTSGRACVDKPAGELARSGCSVFKAATQDFAAGATCAASVLSSGAFMNQQIDFNGAGRDFCMATGEFTYALTSVLIPSKSPEQKAQQITSSLDRFIQTVRRSYQQADAIRRKFDSAVTLADAGINVAGKFATLAGCGGTGAAAPVPQSPAPQSPPQGAPRPPAPPGVAHAPPAASPPPPGPTPSPSPPPAVVPVPAPTGQAAAGPTATAVAPQVPVASAAPSAPPVAPGSAANAINGQTLSAIRYQGPEGRGSFAALPDGSWVQESAQGRKTYVQYSRMPWVVHLVERHRRDDILIDLQRMKVRRSGPERSDLFDIVEVRGLDGAFVSQVAAPPEDNCGGYFEAMCKQGGILRCDEGLVETYMNVRTMCLYSSRKTQQLTEGAPFQVKYPALNPSNPDHRKLLAGKTTLHMVPVSYPGAQTREVTVQASGADTIRDLVAIFAKRNKLDAKGITLSFLRKTTGYERPEVELDETQPVAAYGLENGTRLAVGQKPACEGLHCRVDIIYYPVHELSNFRTSGGSMPMTANDTILQVKSRFLRPNAPAEWRRGWQLEDHTLAPAQITLMFEGKAMDDDNRTLASYGVGLDQYATRIGIIFRK